MKKCFLYLAGLLVLLAYSCTDEQLVEQTGNKLRITGSLASDSRTTFVEGEGVIETHWNVDDEIGLYTDKQSNLLYRATNDGKSTDFIQTNETGLLNEEGKTVYAYYPYYNFPKGDIVRIYGNSATLTPEYHQLDHPNNPRPFLYSKAQITGNTLNFKFKHLYAYLNIEISAQSIKEQLEATQKAYPNEEITSKGAWIEIYSDNNLVPCNRSEFNIKTEELSGEFYKYIKLYLDNIDLDSDNVYEFLIPIMPQPGGTKITGEIHFGKPLAIDVFERTVSESGLKAGKVYNWDMVDLNSRDETRKILESFYKKTGGDKWLNNENWLSDKPFGAWKGINRWRGGNYTNNISMFNLQANNLFGEFPEELSALMDMIDGTEYYISPGNYGSNFNILDNELYGSIPKAVKEHRYWNKLGWNIIRQTPIPEGDIDLTESNLYIENIQVEDLFADESTVSDLYEIFKKNKLTQIIVGYMGSDMSIENIKKYFPNSRVNLHLDYQSKGLQTLIYCGETAENEEGSFRNNINALYGSVPGVQWLKGNSPIPNHARAAGYFFDSDGQLVYLAFYDAYCKRAENINVIIRERANNFLKTTLGEPVEHPEFELGIYTSTDYSRDGEVVTLQEATVGKGINLVFLGEGFVDKDMESEGIYEQTMHEAMEQFFSYEPYKSFRNRFNVYAVKVVSPNVPGTEGAKMRINNVDAICFEYIQKVPNANNNPPMISVVYNCVEESVDRSYCRSYTDDGSFVSYIYTGISDASVLMHESGGHGFGGLLDEYVEPGYEELTLPENSKTYLDDVWTLYGRGANVDWRNDASTVKWSHFLEDSRYDNEGLGIYEGAYLYGYGAYRPNENSIMRNNYADGVQFNAPSREQIYKRIMQRSEGKSWTYDYEKFVEYDAINRKLATRAAVRPLSEAEKKEYAKKHCPPTFIKGTWRDAMKNGKSNTVVPLR